MTEDLSLAKRGRFITVLGAVMAVLGAAGTLGISAMLAFLLPALAEGSLSYFFNQALFQVMWAVFFISLFVAGVSLIVSGVKRKRHDLVPGLTLYFLGAALVVNALLLLTYGHLVYALTAAVIGCVVMYAEWSTEVI